MRKALLAAVLTILLQGVAPAAPLDAASDPDRAVGTGTAVGAGIAEVWLIGPTRRYDHFVRGNSSEASGVRLRLADGEVLSFSLDDRHVFEDAQPRLADFDGDGVEEIVLVQSSLDAGASLAIYRVSNGAITLRAQTPYIGQIHRWLNPAGIGDFDGDGHLDIALVQMPHLEKRLEVWSLRDNALQRTATLSDVANHKYGSTSTAMSAIADFNGDGLPDLALPSGDRRTIRFVSFAGDEAVEIGAVPLPFPADGDFTLSGAVIQVPTEDGKVVAIRYPG